MAQPPTWCHRLRLPFGSAAALALLCGCAATINSPSQTTEAPIRVPPEALTRVVLRMTSDHARASDWESFKGEWRSAFREQANQNGMTFEAIEDKTPPVGPGTLVDVHIGDYRYVTAGARYGFGIMTGNAFIEANVRFRDAATGSQFGARNYSTSSSAWQGVFSAMTDKQVQVITQQMFSDLRSSKRAGATDSVPMPTPAAQPRGSGTEAPNTLNNSPPIGKDAHQAERATGVNACSAEPRAVLSAKGPGFETYTIACTNGDSLAVRCEFGNCRVLR